MYLILLYFLKIYELYTLHTPCGLGCCLPFLHLKSPEEVKVMAGIGPICDWKKNGIECTQTGIYKYRKSRN